MSVPPQGGWPPHQPGSTPQGPPPFNQPGYNPQQPPPGWQSGPWPQQPAPKGNGVKWLLIAVAVLLVIGISVGATLLFTRDGGGGSTTTSTSGAPSDIASANDTGPVSVIAEEPTCSAFVSISNSLSDIEAKGWGAQRSTLGPRSQWTADQVSQAQEVAAAMENAADQTLPLIKTTPHRFIRELYQQFIAYGRAYAGRIATYQPSDNGLASASINAGSAVVGICNSITYGSASRSIAVKTAEPPAEVAAVGDSTQPTKFLERSDATCARFEELFDIFNSQTMNWQALDSGIASSQWTPEQKAVQEAAFKPINDWASGMELAGRNSGNAALEDFSVAAALYLKTYVSIGDSYVGSDAWLSFVSLRLNNLVLGACKAVT